jgi:hypothetical protein
MSEAFFVHSGTSTVKTLSWEDANLDVVALNCISFNVISTSLQDLGVFGCGQAMRPAPEVCGAGSGGL